MTNKPDSAMPDEVAKSVVLHRANNADLRRGTFEALRFVYILPLRPAAVGLILILVARPVRNRQHPQGAVTKLTKGAPRPRPGVRRLQDAHTTPRVQHEQVGHH